MIDDDIPDFLKLTAQQRREAWKGRKLVTATDKRRGRKWSLPKTLDATAKAMLKTQEREAKARKAARLAALKERRK